MSDNSGSPVLPSDDDDAFGADALADDDGTRMEVDGDEVLDPDANDDALDSAEADRLAADGDRLS